MGKQKEPVLKIDCSKRVLFISNAWWCITFSLNIC